MPTAGNWVAGERHRGRKCAQAAYTKTALLTQSIPRICSRPPPQSLPAAVILGPLLWRKTASWRHERKQRTAQEQRRSDGTGPLQQQLAGSGLWSTRPSNILLLAAAALLVYEHTTALLLPSQHLFRTDLFLALGLGSTNVPMVFLRAKASALPFDNVAWKAEWGEEGLETLLRRLSSFEGRVRIRHGDK